MPKQIIVPDGMIKAAVIAYNAKTAAHGYKYGVDRYVVEAALEAALRWLIDNPIVPQTVDEYRKLLALKNYEISFDAQQFYYAEWQRRMFLAPEPKVPEAIKDLMPHYPDKESHEWAVVEAYRRGKEGR